jgi:hypothetical protein
VLELRQGAASQFVRRAQRAEARLAKQAARRKKIADAAAKRQYRYERMLRKRKKLEDAAAAAGTVLEPLSKTAVHVQKPAAAAAAAAAERKAATPMDEDGDDASEDDTGAAVVVSSYDDAPLVGDTAKECMRRLRAMHDTMLPALGLRAAAVEEGDSTSDVAVQQRERLVLLLAAFLSPYFGHCFPVKKKFVPCVSYLVRDALKGSADLSVLLGNVLQGAHEFIAIVRQAIDGIDLDNDDSLVRAQLREQFLSRRVSVGKLIRSVGSQWLLAQRIAVVLLMLSMDPPVQIKPLRAWLHVAMDTDTLNAEAKEEQPPIDSLSIPPAMLALYAMCSFSSWTQHVSGIAECWSWRPFLDGKAVSKALGMRGRVLGQVMQAQMAWRLEHPTATKTDCEAWLAAQKEALQAESTNKEAKQ